MRGKFSSKNHAIIMRFSYSLKPIIYISCDYHANLQIFIKSILILMVDKNKRGLFLGLPFPTEDLTFIVLIKIILIILSFFLDAFLNFSILLIFSSILLKVPCLLQLNELFPVISKCLRNLLPETSYCRFSNF